MRYLITGGSKGISRTIAEQLLTNGHQVICVSRQQEGAPPGAQWFCHDVLKDELSAEIFDEPLDGLVYAPGSIVLKPFRTLTAEQFRQDFEINVVGAVKVIQAALPSLKRSGNASIVLFSTVAVGQGMPFHSTIAAAKGAVEALTRSLAAEFAPVIRVNAIAPSLTETPLAEKWLGTLEKKEASARRHPLNRYGQTEDIASAATFLLDPKNSWISGQILHVDGGLSTLRTA